MTAQIIDFKTAKKEAEEYAKWVDYQATKLALISEQLDEDYFEKMLDQTEPTDH